MRNHASCGSLNEDKLVLLNQDAYDKFRLSKEDYELQKELEKEQDKTKEDESKKDKQKDKDKKEDTKEEKVKDIVVELKNMEDRIVRLTPNTSN